MTIPDQRNDSAPGERSPDEIARAAWGEEDWIAFEEKDMRHQPDLAQFRFDDPPTWREYLADAIKLAATMIAAGALVVGFHAVATALRGAGCF